MPALSVVLPVHNGMPYVEESVRSILDQSFADFELVVGDDGSDDGTTGVLRAIAGSDPRVRLLRRGTRSGLAASANWVISEASAPLVAIAHADDVSCPRRLERQIELIGSEPGAVLVGTLSDGIDEKGRRVRPANWSALIRPGAFAPFGHSSVMFRRDAFDRAGGYRSEAEYWEDLDLYLRLSRLGRLLVIPEVLTLIRHARISTRLRDRQDEVEEKVALMYRCVAAFERGEDYDSLLGGSPGEAGGKLNPRTFVACGWTALWGGRRPGVLKRMLRRAELRFDSNTLQSAAWVLWATISPKTLRLFIRWLRSLGGQSARRAVSGRRYVEWQPRPGPDSER